MALIVSSGQINITPKHTGYNDSVYEFKEKSTRDIDIDIENKPETQFGGRDAAVIKSDESTTYSPKITGEKTASESGLGVGSKTLNNMSAAFTDTLPLTTKMVQEAIGLQERTKQTPFSYCPSCGAVLGQHIDLTSAPVDITHGIAGHDDAQRRIAELEAQLKILGEKASVAVNKLAEYEDELHKLKQQKQNSLPTITTSNSAPPLLISPQPEATTKPITATPSQKISAFLTAATRRVATLPTTPSDHEPRPSSSLPHDSKDLERLLITEKQLRERAEGKLQQVTSELEELSASLFQQANEMVANERKARCKLEERVAVLEKRDREKRERLEALERAVERINRVKMVLSESDGRLL